MGNIEIDGLHEQHLRDVESYYESAKDIAQARAAAVLCKDYGYTNSDDEFHLFEGGFSGFPLDYYTAWPGDDAEALTKAWKAGCKAWKSKEGQAEYRKQLEQARKELNDPPSFPSGFSGLISSNEY